MLYGICKAQAQDYFEPVHFVRNGISYTGKVGYEVYLASKTSVTGGGGCTNPATPSLVTPANDSAGVPLLPTLDWANVTGATSYRLRVYDGGNALVLDTANLSSSQFTIYSGVLNYGNPYSWQANATNNCGAGDFSSSRTFTVICDIVMLSFPPDESTSDVDPNRPQQFSWNDVTGAGEYQLQIALLPDFSSLTVSTVTGGIAVYEVSGGTFDPLTLYYWRARASSDGIHYGEWSVPFSFTTTE